MKRDIIKEINSENEKRLLTPLIFGVIFPVIIPVLVILVLLFSETIDSFASSHPLVTGWSLVGIGILGWYKFGRRAWLW